MPGAEEQERNKKGEEELKSKSKRGRAMSAHARKTVSAGSPGDDRLIFATRWM